MTEMENLRNMVRKGVVQSVDAKSMRARVKFGDKGGMNSGDLYILVTGRAVVPRKKDTTGDKTAEKEGHTHNAYVTDWIPEIGSMVLCLMVPGDEGEGFILGGWK